jgi:zinc and cadmium transporter
MVVLEIILSVLIVSAVSFVGLMFLSLQHKRLDKILLILVSLSAGTLFGGAFLHLLPEAVEKLGFSIEVSLLLLAGVVVFFVLEKIIHWRHCHVHGQKAEVHQEHRPSHIAILNLTGDALHNFLDGLVIAAAYIVSLPVGIAATIAVIFHEIPQEIADFGVLIYGGFSRAKALFMNFLSATLAIIGAIVGILLSSRSELMILYILPFAAGGFLYIAGSNLIPELHKECGTKDSLSHFFALVLGIALMYALRFLGWNFLDLNTNFCILFLQLHQFLPFIVMDLISGSIILKRFHPIFYRKQQFPEFQQLIISHKSYGRAIYINVWHIFK